MRVTQISINEHANVVHVHLDGPMGPIWRDFVAATFCAEDIAKFLNEAIRVWNEVSQCRALFCEGAVILPFAPRVKANLPPTPGGVS